ncbi:hypothetical protein C8F04DRAFT_1174167 [Mycena alexandri]|uniref:Uncharacterized protein n=1 Tax=Mycena alexandri TaxID=1745969 RepID=A0AAD6TFG3_9AGAR|nr:hypothetical protein C8F04DRAFT_1174167 [Mycena alexandri]
MDSNPAVEDPSETSGGPGMEDLRSPRAACGQWKRRRVMCAVAGRAVGTKELDEEWAESKTTGCRIHGFDGAGAGGGPLESSGGGVGEGGCCNWGALSAQKEIIHSGEFRKVPRVAVGEQLETETSGGPDAVQEDLRSLVRARGQQTQGQGGQARARLTQRGRRINGFEDPLETSGGPDGEDPRRPRAACGQWKRKRVLCAVAGRAVGTKDLDEEWAESKTTGCRIHGFEAALAGRGTVGELWIYWRLLVGPMEEGQDLRTLFERRLGTGMGRSMEFGIWNLTFGIWKDTGIIYMRPRARAWKQELQYKCDAEKRGSWVARKETYMMGNFGKCPGNWLQSQIGEGSKRRPKRVRPSENIATRNIHPYTRLHETQRGCRINVLMDSRIHRRLLVRPMRSRRIRAACFERRLGTGMGRTMDFGSSNPSLEGPSTYSRRLKQDEYNTLRCDAKNERLGLEPSTYSRRSKQGLQCDAMRKNERLGLGRAGCTKRNHIEKWVGDERLELAGSGANANRNAEYPPPHLHDKHKPQCSAGGVLMDFEATFSRGSIGDFWCQWARWGGSAASESSPPVEACGQWKRKRI